MQSNILLKLHAFGIKLLHDPNWTGMEMYDYLKQHVRQRVEPKNMLYETITDGLLFHIGRWTYEEYLQHDERFKCYLELSHEYLLWYLEDFVELLQDIGIKQDNQNLIKTKSILERFDTLYVEDESEYFSLLNKQNKKLRKQCVKLSRKFNKELEIAKDEYAREFAERVFHDRTLCEYISHLIILIGFYGGPDDTEQPEAWIERKRFPEWSKRAVIARDRGICANCGKNLVGELEDPYHFDHIVPLSKAGTNDLSNLQLLCSDCNLKKSNNLLPVNSSIPRYLQIWKKRT